MWTQAGKGRSLNSPLGQIWIYPIQKGSTNLLEAVKQLRQVGPLESGIVEEAAFAVLPPASARTTSPRSPLRYGAFLTEVHTSSDLLLESRNRPNWAHSLRYYQPVLNLSVHSC